MLKGLLFRMGYVPEKPLWESRARNRQWEYARERAVNEVEKLWTDLEFMRERMDESHWAVIHRRLDTIHGTLADPLAKVPEFWEPS